MILYLLQTVAAPSDSKGWLEDHATTLGTVVVILLFMVERILSRKEKRGDQKSNWYHNVIVLPHVSLINKFFQEYLKKTNEVFADLQLVINTAPLLLPQSKAVHFNQLKLLINNLDLDFNMLVYHYSLTQYSALNKILSDLQDEVVNVLDKPALLPTDVETLNQIVKNKKSLFFDLLYRQIKGR
jgi:hypothetical protein